MRALQLGRRCRVLLAIGGLALAAACASSGPARPSPFPTAPAPAGAVPTAAPAPPSINDAPAARTKGARSSVVDVALGFRGVPYKQGGESPQTGFDCSGYVQYVFAQVHVALPRTVGEQFHAGAAESRKDVRAGDLLFFTTTAPGATHVAIAINHDEFVHAPSSNGVVRVEALSSSYWGPRFVGARRMK